MAGGITSSDLEAIQKVVREVVQPLVERVEKLEAQSKPARPDEWDGERV